MPPRVLRDVATTNTFGILPITKMIVLLTYGNNIADKSALFMITLIQGWRNVNKNIIRKMPHIA